MLIKLSTIINIDIWINQSKFSINERGSNMNLRHLYFFKELAQTEHMAKAAENLGISQPSLSYAIKKLEDELGVPLFEADGRNIKLTQIGSVYLNYVVSGLDELQKGTSMVRQLMNSDAGHVSLGFTYTLGQQLVPDLILNFQKIKQNSKITFDLGQSNSIDLLQGLYSEKFDMIFASNIDKLGEQSTDNLFDVIPLVQQEIVAVVPEKHPLALVDQLEVKDLAPFPLIAFSQNSGLRPLIDKIFNSAHVQPKIMYEVEEDNTMASFVQHGFGVALIPYLPLLKEDGIIIKHLKNLPVQHQIFLIIKRNHFVTPSVHRFQEFSKSYCWQHYTHLNKLL